MAASAVTLSAAEPGLTAQLLVQFRLEQLARAKNPPLDGSWAGAAGPDKTGSSFLLAAQLRRTQKTVASHAR